MLKCLWAEKVEFPTAFSQRKWAGKIVILAKLEKIEQGIDAGLLAFADVTLLECDFLLKNVRFGRGTYSQGCNVNQHAGNQHDGRIVPRFTLPHSLCLEIGKCLLIGGQHHRQCLIQFFLAVYRRTHAVKR